MTHGEITALLEGLRGNAVYTRLSDYQALRKAQENHFSLSSSFLLFVFLIVFFTLYGGKYDAVAVGSYGLSILLLAYSAWLYRTALRYKKAAVIFEASAPQMMTELSIPD